ncbi:MAG TPA: NAD(P)H-dependent oxidoreductase, partial [Chitinophagaceae bacterium]|nr:NAD(P)H-dependent oxidoreductase [Chitinophagaceae bacterium]
MYTIIAATNRKGSNTLKVAKQYQLFFQEAGVEAQLFSLEDFASFEYDEAYKQIEQAYLVPTSKYVFVMPEYNGSFPGIFKLMMDISNLAVAWNHKKVMLVGVSSGRAGNLRGIDIMTNMCHYMKMNVFHHKLPLSSILSELEDDRFVNKSTIDTIK